MTDVRGGPGCLSAATGMLAIAGAGAPRIGDSRLSMVPLAIHPAPSSAGTAAHVQASSRAAGEEERRAFLPDAGGSGTALWNQPGGLFGKTPML